MRVSAINADAAKTSCMTASRRPKIMQLDRECPERCARMCRS